MAMDLDGRVGKSDLVRGSPLLFDSVREKTLLTDNPHVDQAPMDTGRQEFPAQPGQGRSLRSPEQVRSNGEIELIDETAFQQRTKQRWTPFAGERAHIVLMAQNSQHLSQIDMVQVSEMQRGFPPERSPGFPGHSDCRKNNNG